MIDHCTEVAGWKFIWLRNQGINGFVKLGFYGRHDEKNIKIHFDNSLLKRESDHTYMRYIINAFSI